MEEYVHWSKYKVAVDWLVNTIEAELHRRSKYYASSLMNERTLLGAFDWWTGGKLADWWISHRSVFTCE